MSTVIPSPPAVSRNLIAPRWHTVLLLVFLTAPLISGLIVQRRHATGNQIFTDHSAAMMRFYVPVLIFEWFLVIFTWFGIRTTGMSLKDLIGGRWKGLKDFTLDSAIGVAVWISLLAIGAVFSRVLGPDQANGINVIMPHGPLEMAIWVAVASTAGFVEELVFRGYLQTQFARLGLPVTLAIAAQALVFALGHAYEGRNAVSVITAYATLFGALAVWRRSLRPGMIGHIGFDISIVFLMGK